MSNHNYSLTTKYVYCSRFGLPDSDTAVGAKLADLTEAAYVLLGEGMPGIVWQIRHREGRAFEAIRVLAELIEDWDTLTDELADKKRADLDAWIAKRDAEEAASSVIAAISEPAPELD